MSERRSDAAGDSTDGAERSARRAERSWFVQNVLPWLSSLGVHAAVILLGVAAARLILVTIRTHEEPQIGATDGGVDVGKDISLPQIVGRDNRLEKFLQDQNLQAADQGGLSPEMGKSVQLAVATGGQGDSTPGDLITMGLGAGKGHNGTFGAGVGPLVGADGPSAPFGPAGGGMNIRGVIFRTDKAARQIAFVCDCSGSMISKMASLKAELEKAVGGLKPIQSFNVIFFQDQKFAAFSGDGLVLASPESKRRAFRFLEDVTPSGTTDPIPGLELAFKQKPQVVFLLTDGDFKDNEEVRRKVRQLNAGGKVQVHTIAFVNDDDHDEAFRETLKQIAAENHGSYRFVRESDLDR